MYLCYVDESGTPEIPGNTTHFILTGLSIPIWKWKLCELDINRIKNKYDLSNKEIHTAWLLRHYLEQNKILDFNNLSRSNRRYEVGLARRNEILRIQKLGNPKLLQSTKKNYKHSESYIHLSYDERKKFILEIGDVISSWGFARLFAECIDKVFFDPSRASQTVSEQSFEQVVSRFEQYLAIMNSVDSKENCYGLIIHDNNDTVSRKHTGLMKQFHQKGTLWTDVNYIIETPLFVDSSLTSMIQIADVCSYAIRRYLENNEEELFDKIFTRADRKNGLTVGVRHFTRSDCTCKICSTHKSS